MMNDHAEDMACYSNMFRICETYTELPDIPVSFSPTKPIVFKLFSPSEPVDASIPLMLEDEDLGVFCISTYPTPSGKPHRSGSPIADVFGLVVQSDGSIIASLADGSGWGVKARNAARAASQAFLEYILSYKPYWFGSTALHIGHLLLRGFSTAHEHILEGVEQQRSEAGTTTLLGVVVTPMLNSLDWIAVTCSVGNTKAFLYSPKADVVYEISVSPGRADATYPGGRLGPHFEPYGEPDLHNLCLQSTQCSAGDYLIMLTDGVYDNLDPMYQGVSPRYCGLDADSWLDGNRLHLGIRSMYIRRFLRDRFIVKDDKLQLPPQITADICNFLQVLTQPSRDFHQTQPNKKLPHDFVKYPGQMDHSTALCMLIPSHSVSSRIKQSSNQTAQSIPILLCLSSSADLDNSQSSFD